MITAPVELLPPPVPVILRAPLATKVYMSLIKTPVWPVRDPELAEPVPVMLMSPPCTLLRKVILTPLP